jgi:hypothetical protein
MCKDNILPVHLNAKARKRDALACPLHAYVAYCSMFLIYQDLPDQNILRIPEFEEVNTLRLAFQADHPGIFP